ncbi:hypothetical protein [Wolbachia endosymbiont of Diaphorina citri]|nr:hypothetical protein [Wolbachia endosymbiont of Diaphorina citri]
MFTPLIERNTTIPTKNLRCFQLQKITKQPLQLRYIR